MASPRAGRRGGVLMVALDRDSVVPLHRQIYNEIRRGIVSGLLARGSRLPSSRGLADDLAVSRSTVVLAFDQLRLEGYVDSQGRGATRVSDRLPEAMTRVVPGGRDGRPERRGRQPSARATAIANAWPDLRAGLGVPARAFRTSVPALDVFPVDIWSRISARRWRRAPAAALSYGEPMGLGELRAAIADYLTRARAVRCTAAQVVVTAGSQQALDLAARVLTEPGDAAWMEDPGYFGAAGALVANGVKIVPVPVDRDGLDVAEGRRRAPRASLAFVTPARQLPLGVTMSQARREALLDWAAEARAWIVEDDYDSEFRYATRPLAPLHSQDRTGSVIFMGTFSKVVFPSLRLGYLVVPERLIETFASTRRCLDFCPPWHAQAVMTDFMVEGHFERHIRRMRAIYQSRRRLLVSLLERQLGWCGDVDAPDAGMNLIAWLPEGTRDTLVTDRLAAEGIDAMPVSRFTRRRLRPGLMLGYSGIREPDLRQGVAQLASVLRATVGGGR